MEDQGNSNTKVRKRTFASDRHSYKQPNEIIDPDTWYEIEKNNVGDYNVEDVRQISFLDMEAFYEFYKMYARAKGFDVRIKTPTLSKTDQVPITLTLLCNREGERAKKRGKVKMRKLKGKGNQSQKLNVTAKQK